MSLLARRDLHHGRASSRQEFLERRAPHLAADDVVGEQTFPPQHEPRLRWTRRPVVMPLGVFSAVLPNSRSKELEMTLPHVPGLLARHAVGSRPAEMQSRGEEARGQSVAGEAKATHTPAPSAPTLHRRPAETPAAAVP